MNKKQKKKEGGVCSSSGTHGISHNYPTPIVHCKCCNEDLQKDCNHVEASK